MNKIIAAFFFLFAFTGIKAQHYRGLSVINDKVVWMSGSDGTVLRTTNGGKKWETVSPKGYEKKDFRDIHAWDQKTAIIMSSGDSARVLKTTDGGLTWKLVYANDREGVFLDAMDFKGDYGVMVGDPYYDKLAKVKYYFDPNESGWRFDLLYTVDGGDHWIPYPDRPLMTNEGEALFAASGSNILLHWVNIYSGDTVDGFNFSFISSSQQRTTFHGFGNCCELFPGEGKVPLLKGNAAGAYSVVSNRNLKQDNPFIVAVGGSYLEPDRNDSIAAYYDREYGWKLSATQPGGYRSCVAANNDGSVMLTTGPNGTDYSGDRGINWNSTKIRGYNVCAFSDNYVWLAGNKGSWKKVEIKSLK